MKIFIKKYWWILLCVLLTAALPVIVNWCFMNLKFPTGSNLKNEHWLDFWGSYLGSLLGSVAALIALFFTLYQQEKHHADTKETNRLNQLPIPCVEFFPDIIPKEGYTHIPILVLKENGSFLSAYAIESTQFFNLIQKYQPTHMFMKIDIMNIGVGPALDISIFENNDNAEDLCSIGSGQSDSFVLALPQEKEEINLHLVFYDIFGNKYMNSQKCTFDPSTKKYILSVSSTPELIQTRKF